MTTKIGYIGVGAIGRLLALNAIKAGFSLVVYDQRSEACDEFVRLGAEAAPSAKAVAESAEIVAIAVMNDAQVETVVLGKDGILDGARPGTTVLIHSTINPETAVKIGEIAKSKGVDVVDAPLSGGPEGATARTLLFMIGGESEPVEKCKPLLLSSGKNLSHMGGLGTGSMMRIVHHVMLGLNRFAADEGMKLAQALGLDVAKVCKAVGGGEAQSFVIDRYLQKYRDMPTYGLHRVAGIAIRLGYERGLPMIGPALFQQLYLPTKGKY
jgi:2-hydroxy-3-oxopropionate reductase